MRTPTLPRDHQCADPNCRECERNRARFTIDTLTAQRDRLAEALRDCVPHVEHADGCGYKRPDSCIACGANALLAELEG